MKILVGLVALLFLSGCSDGVTTAVKGEDHVVVAERFPAQIPGIVVRVGDFKVSPAVVVPTEMSEIGDAALAELARDGISRALSRSPDVTVLPEDFNGSTYQGKPVLVLTGRVTRVQLAAAQESSLFGNLFVSSTSQVGSTQKEFRTLALDTHYQLLGADRVPLATGAGCSKAEITISGVVGVEVNSTTGESSAKAKHVLKDAKVDRSSLAPAFEVATGYGAQDLLRNWVARQVPVAGVPVDSR